MGTINLHTGSKYEGIFQKFRLGLQNWCNTGKEPAAGDQDMKYYLDLQEKRLKEHGLTMKLHLQPDKEVMSVHQTSEMIPLVGSRFARFKQSLYTQFVTRTVSFAKDGKELYQKKDYLSMYQTILDPEPEDKGLGETTYVCPNCGSITKLEALQESGCPYCGTRYLMKDLYPKVTNYYFVDTGSKSENTWKKQKTFVLLAAAVASLLQTAYTVLTDEEIGVLLGAVTFLFGFALWAFLIYFVCSLCLLIHAGKEAAKAASLLGATAGAKSKITRQLQKCDPSFDYEYFEGKALSLARMIMLSQHPEECVQYRGPACRDRFSDIVDIQYRGGIGVRQIKRDDARVEVNLDLYLTNALYSRGKIKQKAEKIQVRMYHNAAFPVDRSFSIVKVQCPNCGGSFDARKEKCCPYCNQPYDAGVNDWIVTEISR